MAAPVVVPQHPAPPTASVTEPLIPKETATAVVNHATKARGHLRQQQEVVLEKRFVQILCCFALFQCTSSVVVMLHLV